MGDIWSVDHAGERCLEEFVVRKNIERYKKLLEERSWTDLERQTLLRLLQEEEEKLEGKQQEDGNGGSSS